MIDLGVLGPDAVPAVSRRRRPPAWPSRWLAVPVALAVAWFGLAGATASGSFGLIVLSTVPMSTDSQYAIAGDSLYLAEQEDAGSRITAYRLRDGGLRWSTPVRLPTFPISFVATDGVVLASVNLPGFPGDQTVVLDEQTGRTLWSSPDVLQALIPARHRAVLTRDFPMDIALVPGAAPTDKLGTEVVAVDLRDGREAWLYQTAEGCEHAVEAVSAAGARMAVLCPADPPASPEPAGARQPATSETDELRTVDLATGREDRAVRLTLSMAIPPDPRGVLRLAGAPIRPWLLVAAGRILVGAAGDNGDGTVTLNAYDPITLRPLWTQRLSDNDYGVTPCAGQLCLTDAYGLAVVDPDTGTVRWRSSEQAFAQLSGELAARLLVERVDSPDPALVEAGTGRSVLELPGWRAVGGGPGTLSIFARWQSRPDGRTLFATVTMDPPGLRLVGFAPDVLEDRCRTDGDYLVCQTLTQTLRVWRYRG